MPEVVDWLKTLGMSEYAERFAESDIDSSVLPELTDQDLERTWRLARASAEDVACDRASLSLSPGTRSSLRWLRQSPQDTPPSGGSSP